MTTIYVPDGLAHELGDQVIMDVDQSPTNRIEYVRSEAFEKAKMLIDDLIVSRAVMPAGKLTTSPPQGSRTRSAYFPAFLDRGLGVAAVSRLAAGLTAVHATAPVLHCWRFARLPGTPGMSAAARSGVRALHGISHCFVFSPGAAGPPYPRCR
jgi:hypothetical protein